MGGSWLITAFINQALLDELRLFVMPTLLGEGTALFANLTRQTSARLLHAKTCPGGPVELRYAFG